LAQDISGSNGHGAVNLRGIFCRGLPHAEPLSAEPFRLYKDQLLYFLSVLY